MQHSQYHIDGWLTDYECVTDLEGVDDVIVFSSLLEGYTGECVTPNEWGKLQLKTIEEVGLSDHEMVRRLPNDKWTSVISESEWIDLKAHIENKLNPNRQVPTKKASVRETALAARCNRPSEDDRLIEVMRNWTGEVNRKGLPRLKALSDAVGFEVSKPKRKEITNKIKGM